MFVISFHVSPRQPHDREIQGLLKSKAMSQSLLLVVSSSTEESDDQNLGTLHFSVIEVNLNSFLDTLSDESYCMFQASNESFIFTAGYLLGNRKF